MIEKQNLQFPAFIIKLISGLKEGNRRFASASLLNKDLKAIRQRHVQGQSPKAIILSCADSRVSPEYIFDVEPGDLFIIRVAGNILSNASIGSIELAVHSLGCRLLVILGHEDCGAVKAAKIGHTGSEHLISIINHILPEIAANTEKDTSLTASVIANVENQIEKAEKNELLKKMIEDKELYIIGGVYMLESGEVKLFV